MPDFHGIKAETREEAFSIAAANSMLTEMKNLLAEGTDINCFGKLFRTTPLASACSLGLIRSVRFLIENGADVNIPCRDVDLTPLMHACSAGKIKGSEISQLLLDAGADVTYTRKSDEMTALKFAVKTCTPELIQNLINKGADIDGPNGTDQTALMIAARANNIENLKVLIENGANRYLTCKLPWAKNMTAEQMAKTEKCFLAQEYLSSLPVHNKLLQRIKKSFTFLTAEQSVMCK